MPKNIFVLLHFKGHNFCHTLTAGPQFTFMDQACPSPSLYISYSNLRACIGLLPGSNGLSEEERKGLEDSHKTRGKGPAEVHMKGMEQLELKIEQIEHEKTEAEKELSIADDRAKQVEGERVEDRKRMGRLEQALERAEAEKKQAVAEKKHAEADKKRVEEDLKQVEGEFKPLETDLDFVNSKMMNIEKDLRVTQERFSESEVKVALLKEVVRNQAGGLNTLQGKLNEAQGRIKKGEKDILELRKKLEVSGKEVAVAKLDLLNKNKSLRDAEKEAKQLKYGIIKMSKSRSETVEKMGKEIANLKSYLKLKDVDIRNKEREVKLKNQEIAFFKSKDSMLDLEKDEFGEERSKVGRMLPVSATKEEPLTVVEDIKEESFGDAYLGQEEVFQAGSVLSTTITVSTPFQPASSGVKEGEKIINKKERHRISVARYREKKQEEKRQYSGEDKSLKINTEDNIIEKVADKEFNIRDLVTQGNLNIMKDEEKQIIDKMSNEVTTWEKKYQPRKRKAEKWVPLGSSVAKKVKRVKKVKPVELVQLQANMVTEEMVDLKEQEWLEEDIEDIEDNESGMEEVNQADGGTKFHCRICGKVCLDRVKMKDHIEKHNQEDPYSCSFCKKRFKRSETKPIHETKCYRRKIIAS